MYVCTYTYRYEYTYTSAVLRCALATADERRPEVGKVHVEDLHKVLLLVGLQRPRPPLPHPHHGLRRTTLTQEHQIACNSQSVISAFPVSVIPEAQE